MVANIDLKIYYENTAYPNIISNSIGLGDVVVSERFIGTLIQEVSVPDLEDEHVPMWDSIGTLNMEWSRRNNYLHDIVKRFTRKYAQEIVDEMIELQVRAWDKLPPRKTWCYAVACDKTFKPHLMSNLRRALYAPKSKNIRPKLLRELVNPRHKEFVLICPGIEFSNYGVLNTAISATREFLYCRDHFQDIDVWDSCYFARLLTHVRAYRPILEKIIRWWLDEPPF